MYVNIDWLTAKIETADEKNEENKEIIQDDLFKKRRNYEKENLSLYIMLTTRASRFRYLTITN